MSPERRGGACAEHCRALAIHQARVNVKSLAAESRMIRKEVEKARRKGRENWVVAKLNRRRISELRVESRLAQLALAYLRGKPYRTVERRTARPVCVESLVRKLKRFLPDSRIRTPDIGSAAVEAWLNES